MTKITNLPKEYRPRERLILYGPESLKNSELLAIILGTGTIKKDVLTIAEEIFPTYTPIPLSIHSNPLTIAKEMCIPLTHACKLIAVFELGKRCYKRQEEAYIHTAHDAYMRLSWLKKHSKEHLIGLYLNTRNKIIHEEIISIGTINASLISPKEVIEPAIRTHAVYLVICHNHPSGDPDPSDEDIKATKLLRNACAIMNVKLLDHVIIGNKTYCSLKEKGEI